MVQDLVNQVLGAGAWLDQKQENRKKAVQIAAGREYFNQDPNIIRFVMENPTDRVTYGDLRMIRSGIRGAHAAVAARPAPSSTRSHTKSTSTRRFAAQRSSPRRFHCECTACRDRLHLASAQTPVCTLAWP